MGTEPPIAADAMAGSSAGSRNLRRIAFDAGTPSVTGPMTWAQQHMLLLVEALHPASQSLNIGFHIELRAGPRPDQVLDALRRTVETFGALRTLYVPPPEGPAQRLLGSGELSVELVEAPAEISATIAAEVAEELRLREFTVSGDLPLRAALITVGGQVRHIAFALSHLTIDYTGAMWMVRHLRMLLTRPRLATAEPVHQPLDEAGWESSPAGRRRGERGVEHHALAFRAMPQTMLPRPVGEYEPPRWRYLEFDSPALALASAALAGRHNVSPTAVLYAGVCAVAGYVSRLDRAYLQLTVGNRVSRTRFAVGMFTEDVPIHLDLTDAGLAEVIDRAGKAVPQSVLFGQYPPGELATRRREIELDRGVCFDLSCWLNDRRSRARPGIMDDLPSARMLAEAAGRTEWRWIDGPDNSTSSYFVFADDVGAALRLTVIVDSALLPADEAVEWLRAVERVLTGAVTAEIGVAEIGARTGLRQSPTGDDWCRVDHSWAHLPSVAELVRTAAGTPHGEVFAVPAPEGTRLVAYLASTAAGIDPAKLHRDIVAALPGVRTVVAPHSYILCTDPPATPGIESWQRLPVLLESDGRLAPLPEGAGR